MTCIVLKVKDPA